MSSGELASRLRDTAALLDMHAPTTDTLRAIQATENALAVMKARLTVEMTEHADHEAEGYSSTRAWVTDQLRLDSADARDLLRAGSTLRDLPDLADAAAAGEVSARHLKAFGYALKHVRDEVTRQAVDFLLPVAQTAEPAQLSRAVKALREAVYPDDLERAWLDGMDKRDLKLTRVGDGWHLTGFLDIETGAKLDTVLHSLGTPRDEGDTRSPSERRVAGLGALLDGVLAHGLPADNGVRPHLTVTVDLADIVADPSTVTAELAGFDTIGPSLLWRLAEAGDLTPILTAGKASVLDVGRRHRFATDKQKRAIDHQQGGRCATPGCSHSIDEYHHVRPWAAGGTTDLGDLTGRCTRCHHDIHASLLHVDPVTHETTRRIRRLTSRRRAA